MKDIDETKQPLLAHLIELRRRLLWCLATLVVTFFVCFAFAKNIFAILVQPLLAAGQGKLIYTDIFEAFFTQVKVALWAAFMLSFPMLAIQLWRFIAPGLYAKEKKLAIPFVILSSTFFVLGAWFGHSIVFPMSWRFFASMENSIMKFQPRLDASFSMYLKMVLAFAVVFQMPTVVLFLARMGVVTGRFLMRHFKYAVLIIFIAAAIITPDGSPVTQTFIAGPMVGLYLFSVLLAWIFGKKRRDAEADI